jgi:Fur family ferric uptake transcriptional regulator
MTTTSANRRPPVADAACALVRIREEGGRVTAAKRSVVELVYASPQARTAEEFADALEGVDRSVIYRTLAQLEELGIVEHVHLGHGSAVYRRRGLATVPVACLVCGDAVEIDVASTEAFRTQVESDTGIALDLVHFPLTGRCRRCRS